MCEMWGSDSDVNEGSRHLECCAFLAGTFFRLWIQFV